MNATAFAIVTFGSPTYGTRKGFYRSAEAAIRDARTLGGGSLQSVRVVACDSVAQARAADISDARPVVWSA
jgi:hypothetical protein